MTLQPSLIAPFQTGLDTDTEPWQSPADSFSIANNVHIFNGTIERRNGYRKFGHLKTLDAKINISGITKALNGVVTTAVNHGLATDDWVFIDGVVGMTQVNKLYFKVTVTLPNKFQLNMDTSAYGVYGGGGTIAKLINLIDRVMGIYQFIKSNGDKETLAFGLTRVNKYVDGPKLFFALDQADIMSGLDTDYVWVCNLQSSSLPNRLYFTNGNPYNGTLNGIRYYDASGTGFETVSFVPSLGGGRNLYGAKILFSGKERLLALDTYENVGGVTTHYPQRARWCQAQGPSNWNDLTPGGGGYVDAPTGDQIISAQSLGDQNIVFFTDSVWLLQPLSDPALPFKWEKINDFRATDGKMATVAYDDYVMSLGIRGITGTDSSQTVRIDNRIKDFIYSNINADEFGKVFGLRDFSNRRTWVLYPGIEEYENSNALIFDEESKGFSTYSISMNCLGHGSTGGDYTLADFVASNDLDKTIEEFYDENLVSYFWQNKNELLLGGNITGDIYMMESGNNDDSVVISTELMTAGWNPYMTEGSQSLFSYLDIYVDTDQRTIAKIEFLKDDETAPYAQQNIDFLPNLDYVSTIETISQANPGIVTASDHGLQTGDIVYIYGVLGMVEVNNGPYTITVIDLNTFSIGVDTSAFGAFLDGGSVFRRCFYKTKVWKRAYSGGVGYVHRVRITSTGENSPITISGFKPVFKQRGNRVVN